MSLYILIALGGAIGAVLRFGIFQLAAGNIDSAFPWGTFTVNVVGSVVMGFLATMFVTRWHLPVNLQYALLAGLLGGFTTFSAFSLDSLRLIQDGNWGHATMYVLGSVILCIVACALGVAIAKSLP
jgi:CrcB protein